MRCDHVGRMLFNYYYIIDAKSYNLWMLQVDEIKYFFFFMFDHKFLGFYCFSIFTSWLFSTALDMGRQMSVLRNSIHILCIYLFDGISFYFHFILIVNRPEFGEINTALHLLFTANRTIDLCRCTYLTIFNKSKRHFDQLKTRTHSQIYRTKVCNQSSFV